MATDTGFVYRHALAYAYGQTMAPEFSAAYAAHYAGAFGDRELREMPAHPEVFHAWRDWHCADCGTEIAHGVELCQSCNVARREL